MKPDLFEAPDYYNLDDLLTEEHKLVRDAAREWVKRDVSPIIEDYAQKAEFPTQIINGLVIYHVRKHHFVFVSGLFSSSFSRL